MALHTTRWYPDTCGCVIDYEWDDTVPEDARIHSLTSMSVCCAAHVALAPPVAFNTVMEENRRKNQALAIAQGLLPGLVQAECQWEFDPQRRLQVRFPRLALTPGQRGQLQGALDITLGSGLVALG